MDARLAREEAGKFKTRIPDRTWYEWFWAIDPKTPARPTDASISPIIRTHFRQMLDQTDPPETFKPSDVAQLLSNKELKSLGYETWKDAIPAIYEAAWELREFGDCVILRKGEVLGEDVSLAELDGPVRIGRSAS